MSTTRVVVVGAGVGGLTAALLLAARGADVTVLERAASPGGKMRRLAVGPVTMDAGPTVFTMRWVFDEVLAAAGLNFNDVVSLTKLDTLARHAWDQSGALDLSADVSRSADAIGEFAGAIDARGFREFTAAARHSFQSLRDTFLTASLPSAPGLVARMGVSGLRQFMHASPMRTMWSELSRHFRDPRLRQLFGRYATYVGSSPFQSPATLMLIAHVEQDGVWLVNGGMHALAQGLARAVERRAGVIRYGSHVSRILVERGRTAGVELAGGERIVADCVVYNGDAAAIPSGLLGAAAAKAVARPRGERSLSAVTWLLHARAHGFPLVRHSVFFSRDYQREFDELFAQRRVPLDPTVYVCAEDRGDADHPAPVGPERLFCLINAPANGDAHQRSRDTVEIQRCQHAIINRLAACGLTIDTTAAPNLTVTPADFERLFPATGGALYGQASHGWMASFQRPGARTSLAGLYLAGGSTHPGAGVPMAALSARLAVSSLLQDLSSPARFLPAAMRGGISTA